MPDLPKRCNAPLHYEGQERGCSLAAGHPGPHRTWVEEADVEREYDRDVDAESRRAEREDLGWR